MNQPAHPRIGPLRQIAYASGNLGKSSLWTTFETALLFYWVTFCGMPPSLAGAILAVAMIWDGLADFAIAYASDRWAWRADRIGFLWLAAPLGGAGFFALFAIGQATRGQGWLAMGLAYYLCRAGYTVCDVVHNALIVALSSSARDASRVSGFRLIFSAGGAALVGMALKRALAEPGLEARLSASAGYAAWAAVAYVATLLVAGRVSARMPGLATTRGAPPPARAIAVLWRERAYRGLLAVVAAQAMLMPLFLKSLPFFAQTWRGHADWAGNALIGVTAAQSLSLPLWMLLTHQGLSNGRLQRLSYGLLLAALAILGLGRGGGADTVGLVLAGAAYSGMNMAAWALVAMHGRATLFRRLGLSATPVGLFVGVLKGFAGLGTLLSSAMLTWAIHAPLAAIGVLALGLPALGCGIGLWLSARTARIGKNPIAGNVP